MILVQSGTGSGKTVLVPKFVLKRNQERGESGKIIVTNPKIITTVNNASFSAQCSDVALGEEIGYQYKGAPAEHFDEKRTRLVYATDGVLISIIMNRDKKLEKYSCVVIDEVHERNLNIDILLKLVKQILATNPRLKLVIMSATVDESLFRKYFERNGVKFGGLFVQGQPNFQISRTFATEKEYEIIKKDPIRAGVTKIVQLLSASFSGGATASPKKQSATQKKRGEPEPPPKKQTAEQKQEKPTQRKTPASHHKGDILMFVATQ